MAARNAPRGIEDILASRKAEQDAASKPVFMSKKERASQALAKRQAEVEGQRKKEEEAAQSRLELQHQLRANTTIGGSSSSSQSTQPAASSSRNTNTPRRELPNNVPTGPKAQRNGNVKTSNDSPMPPAPPLPYDMPPPPPPPKQNLPPPPPTDIPKKRTYNEYEAPSEFISSQYQMPQVDDLLLRTRYLGANNDKKRKVRKQSDKKFVFDWDKTDDTGAAEFDPLYKSQIEGKQGVMPGQLYGRGRIAGFEPVYAEQREYYGNNGMEVDVVKKENDEKEMVLAGPTAISARAGVKKGALDDRHWSDKPLQDMKERDWRIFREDFSIAARGGQIPHPLRSWKESAIPMQLLEVIESVGYTDPSPIQRQAIPIGLQNRDLIGIAETGSGKTASFLIPMLDYIGRLPPMTDDNRHLGPYALVMAPTRELAQQIESESAKFSAALGYRSVSIVGGKSIEEQQQQLENGCEIIIATPGRLKDIIERHILVLGQCTYVIMDEADRMVDLGFEAVINFILDALPLSNLKPDTEEAENGAAMTQQIVGPDGQPTLYRQTVMFSATMPPAVERLARKYMRRPAVVTIGVAGQAVDTVEQRVEFIGSDEKKKQRLIEILNTEMYAPPIIVFVNQKRTADQLAKDVNRARWRATTLHSDKNQEQREAALASLRNGESDVLVATDLAGRGIDVSDVSLVVNYQMAKNIESYVHRIGRTGRAGKQGTAITFLNDELDKDVMYDLKQEIMKSKISKAPTELVRHQAAQSKVSQQMRQMAENEGADV